MSVERESLEMTLTAIKVCYTTFALVGLVLNVLSYLTARRDLFAIRLSGKNGARLRMARMARREEFSLAIVLFIIVVIGLNSLATPVPEQMHNVISGIVTGVGWLIIVVIIAFNAVANYLGRRIIYDKLDEAELSNLTEYNRMKLETRLALAQEAQTKRRETKE